MCISILYKHLLVYAVKASHFGFKSNILLITHIEYLKWTDGCSKCLAMFSFTIFIPHLAKVHTHTDYDWNWFYNLLSLWCIK